MSEMKICIIRHAYFPDDPRDRKQTFALLEAGHSVDVLCLRKLGQAASESDNKLKVFRIPLTHKRASIFRYITEYLLSFIMISVLISYLYTRKRYDCIQVSTMPDFLVFTTLLPKLLGAKVLLDLHEPTPEVWVTKHENRLPLLQSLQKNIEKMAIGYADRAITVTGALRHRFGERGANIEKFTVISNTCEEVFCEYSGARRSIPDGEFQLVTHGVIEERYGHEVVVRAVNSLRQRLPNLRLKILGDGEYKTAVTNLVRHLGCSDLVRFLGYVPFSDLLQELWESDIGVVAMNRSPYSELVDTNKMYEYIALRKPVIISRLKAVEENFDDSCIMFFEPGNHEDLARCIVEFHDNPEKRHELAENAYRRYEKTWWGETKKIYLRVIEGLIGEGTE